mmetsp:Transcript_28526/g.32799  ORF Transcript_28526/g.32799 Transcript_28526/m.32799 type:complete len:83 (+) Transcript_28526:223-471(+)
MLCTVSSTHPPIPNNGPLNPSLVNVYLLSADDRVDSITINHLHFVGLALDAEVANGAASLFVHNRVGVAYQSLGFRPCSCSP